MTEAMRKPLHSGGHPVGRSAGVPLPSGARAANGTVLRWTPGPDELRLPSCDGEPMSQNSRQAAVMVESFNAIANLTIDDFRSGNVGLFARLGASARVEGLGLTDVNVPATASSVRVGALAGTLSGTVVASHATSRVVGNSSGATGARVGGLVGRMRSGSRLAASYSPATVASDGIGGGLAGCDGNGSIAASYAAGAVGTADESAWHFGGDYGYPALHCGVVDAAAQRTDYDRNGNGPIDISALVGHNLECLSG